MKKPYGKPGRPKGSTADKPKSRVGRKGGSCKICDYLKKHASCDLNRQFIEGISSRAVTKEYGFGARLIKKHRENCLTKRMQSAANAREAKAGLDLMECAKEIYDDCKDNAGKAKTKAETARDFRDASGCWDPAAKALGLLKVEEKPQDIKQVVNINRPKLSDEELEAYGRLAAKFEGVSDTEGASTSD